MPELVLSPSTEQGYYLFVRPLTSGNHTIRWISSGCVPGLSQDITYHLTMLGAGPNHWQHRRWKVTRLGHPVLRKVTEEI